MEDMKMEALGMVETRGLVAAIEAADAMLGKFHGQRSLVDYSP